MTHTIDKAKLQFVRKDKPQLGIGFFQRLVKFYQRQPKPDISPIWQGIHKQFYGAVMDAAHSGNADLLMVHLTHLFSGQTLYGIDVGVTSNFDKANGIDRWCRFLIRLGERIALVPLFNPEQPNSKTFNAADLLARAAALYDMYLNHPGAPGMPGIEVEGGIFSPAKLIDAANSWLAITRRYGKPGRMLEIGSGEAFVGYLAATSGTIYHSLDLPVTSMFGAYINAHALREDAIWLDGEKPNTDALLYFHGLTKAMPISPFDVVYNQDSLPEIPEAEALALLNHAAKTLASNGRLVSLNHESLLHDQPRVFDLVCKTDAFVAVDRFKSWIRDGYLEEVWKLKPV